MGEEAAATEGEAKVDVPAGEAGAPPVDISKGEAAAEPASVEKAKTTEATKEGTAKVGLEAGEEEKK